MKTTLCERVAGILEREGQVSNFYCIDNRITTRLSDVIWKLKKVGWEFGAVITADKNCTYVVLSYPKAKQLELI